MSGNNKRIYFHNEINARVEKAVKRRFAELCRDKNKRMDELSGEILTEYVMCNTPTTAPEMLYGKIDKWFNKYAYELYTFFIAVCFSMVAMITVFILSIHTEVVYKITIMFGMIILVLISAKIFYIFKGRLNEGHSK